VAEVDHHRLRAGFPELRHGGPQILLRMPGLRKRTHGFRRLITFQFWPKALIAAFAEGLAPLACSLRPPATGLNRCHRWRRLPQRPAVGGPTAALRPIALDRDRPPPGLPLPDRWPFGDSAAAVPPISRRSLPPAVPCGACWRAWAWEQSAAGSKPNGGFQLPPDGPLDMRNGISQRRGNVPPELIEFVSAKPSCAI